MALTHGEVNLSHDELLALYGESAALVESLRKRVATLQHERDQALTALHFMTEALRHRGCCDHVAKEGAL